MINQCVAVIARPDLGLRAASFILAADQPLHALKTLSQDFPLYSAALARKVPLTAKDEVLARGIAENQMSVRMGPGFCGIWINGRAIADNEADAFR
jgi:UDP-glucose:glycoprotein glucosyltransferase